jgi:hypothetical protein
MVLLSLSFKKLNIRLLIIIAAAFQLWDGIITQVYVSSGHVCEGNPLMAPLIRSGVFLPEKIVSIIISVILIYMLSKFSEKIATRASITIIYLYSAVLVWNYANLLVA